MPPSLDYSPLTPERGDGPVTKRIFIGVVTLEMRPKDP